MGVEFIRTYQGIFVANTVELGLYSQGLGTAGKGLDKLAFL